jgi:PIN domain nuclease of toxin-antitoxin system
MKGFLLDSHIVFWAVSGDSRLSRRARAILVGSAPLFFSAASLWELALKERSGKISLAGLDSVLDRARIVELPVRWRDAKLAATLPDLHKDPFDRILLAQAILEDLDLVTADRIMATYPVRTVF